MPLLLLIPLILATGALSFKVVSDEAQQTAETTVPALGNNLVILGAAGVGLYLAFRYVRKIT